MKTSIPVFLRYWAKCEGCGNSVTTCHVRVDAGEELPVPYLPAGWSFVTSPIHIAAGVMGQQTRILCPEHKVVVDDKNTLVTSVPGKDPARSGKSIVSEPGTGPVGSASSLADIPLRDLVLRAREAQERATRVAQVWP